jgi:Na+/H+-dicarboxylate symporter
MSNEEQSVMHHQDGEGLMGKLWFRVMVGLFTGVLVGLLLGPDFSLVTKETSNVITNWLALPGNLFISGIKFIVIPLILASVALGIAGGNDSGAVKKIGISVIAYFMFTTSVAVGIGIFITKLFAPGAGMSKEFIADRVAAGADVDTGFGFSGSSIPEAIVNLIPTNPFFSMANGQMLQLVIASAIIGLALLRVPKKEAQPMMDFLNSVQSITLALVTWLMKFAPIAVFGLIARVTADKGTTAFTGMMAYVFTFLTVLFLLMIFYGIILMVVTRRNPIVFFKSIREPFILAFSTSSSSATMPVTMRTAEEKLGLNPTVSRLVVPLGTTINMDGTAAYQAVVVLFLSQAYGIPLDMAALGSLLAFSIAASIGTPGMPGASLPILVAILGSLSIPPEGIALVFAVDRILDMCRTTVNVSGDLVTATIVEKITGLGLEGPPKVEPAV